MKTKRNVRQIRQLRFWAGLLLVLGLAFVEFRLVNRFVTPYQTQSQPVAYSQTQGLEWLTR